MHYHIRTTHPSGRSYPDTYYYIDRADAEAMYAMLSRLSMTKRARHTVEACASVICIADQIRAAADEAADYAAVEHLSDAEACAYLGRKNALLRDGVGER